MSCPVCEKRTQQGLADCEKQREKLQANNQRLTIVLTVLGTLVGKEMFDYAVGLSESVEQVISQAETEQGSPTGFASSVRPSADGREILLVAGSSPTLFPNVPPLTPSLHFDNSIDPIVLPEVGPMMMLGLLLQPPRKRKP